VCNRHDGTVVDDEAACQLCFAACYSLAEPLRLMLTAPSKIIREY